MKCHIMWHFIWVFTVCQSTRLGISSLHVKRVNNYLILSKTFYSNIGSTPAITLTFLRTSSVTKQERSGSVGRVLDLGLEGRGFETL